MMYEAPRITDFGSIELRVHSAAFSGPDAEPDDAPSPASGGSDGGAFGLALGIGAAVLATIAGRNNESETAGALKTDEEEEVLKPYE